MIVGDGAIGFPHEIEMSSQLLLSNVGVPIETIVEATYPKFRESPFGDNYLTSCAIFASTNEVVDSLTTSLMIYKVHNSLIQSIV